VTRRDLVWRSAGAVLFIGGCAASALHPEGSSWTLLYFLGAIHGIVLMLNGKRVATAWRAERRGHCHTADAIHAARVRHQRRKANASRAEP